MYNVFDPFGLGGKLPDFYISLLAGIVLAVLAWLAAFMRDTLISSLLIPWHAVCRVFGRKPYILIWNDHNRSVSVQIGVRLDKDLIYYRCQAVNTPKQIRNYPMRPWFVRAIILIDTDVTKFAETEEGRKRIEDRLIGYLERGGGLIGAHDVNYRRVGNVQLQKAFDCEVTSFKRVDDPIEYVRNEQFADHTLTAGLPPRFKLNDGEIISGRWGPNTTSVYETRDHSTLVAATEYGSGRLVWLNSGDKKDSDMLCDSLRIPEPELVQLLANAIAWVTRMKPPAASKPVVSATSAAASGQ